MLKNRWDLLYDDVVDISPGYKKYFLLLLLASLTACWGGNSNSGSSSSSVSSGGYLVTTLAGTTARGSADGTGTAAGFFSPSYIASDGVNLFVADSSNQIIRKIVIATGEVSTFAGTAGSAGVIDGIGAAARFSGPEGITIAGDSLYVTDFGSSIIRKIVIATRVVTTLAGQAYIEGANDGVGAAAKFANPSGITNDGTNLFVVDAQSNTIRKIVIATGMVTTFAGTAGPGESKDGIGQAARFSFPRDITRVGANLFVTDSGNHTIRKIVITTGVVTTIAGSAGNLGSSDGNGKNARFYSPTGIISDGANLFVSERNNHTIRKIVIASGEVTTIAGTARAIGSNDGRGAAARFYAPYSITTDGTNLFVADTHNNSIRKIELVPSSSTSSSSSSALVVSSSSSSSSLLVSSSSLSSSESSSSSSSELASSSASSVIVVIPASSSSSSISTATSSSSSSELVSSSSLSSSAPASSSSSSSPGLLGGAIQGNALNPTMVTTFAGVGVSGSNDDAGVDASFNTPNSVTTDGTNLFVVDRNNHTIRKIVIATGVVTTFAGTAGVSGSNDGTGTAAQFYLPRGITTDGTNLFVVDTLNQTIRKIVIATAEVTTLAGAAHIGGTSDGTGADARFSYPRGITFDGANLFVTDTSSSIIRKIVVATGEVTTIAGSPYVSGTSDGTGPDARFYEPSGITTDGINLYVGDVRNYNIRKIVIATGEVTTFAGTSGTSGSNDGTGTNAGFYQPHGITTDGTNLFVADTGSNTIRKIVIASGVVTTLTGQASASGNTDGVLVDARFNAPYGITTDGIRLFVTDSNGHTIRKIE